MKHSKLALLAWLAVPVLLLGACADADGPTSPAPAAEASDLIGLVSGVTRVVGQVVGQEDTWEPVKRDHPLAEALEVEAVVGWRGGRLSAAEVELDIPAGALAKDTKIRMTVLEGEFLHVEFQPHGLEFSKPATVRWDISATSAKGGTAADLQGVYASSLFELLRGLVQVLDVEVEDNRVEVRTSHFSAYGVNQRRGYTAAGAD